MERAGTRETDLALVPTACLGSEVQSFLSPTRVAGHGPLRKQGESRQRSRNGKGRVVLELRDLAHPW